MSFLGLALAPHWPWLMIGGMLALFMGLAVVDANNERAREAQDAADIESKK